MPSRFRRCPAPGSADWLAQVVGCRHCGRYRQARAPGEVAEFFETVNPLPILGPSWNIAPMQSALVVWGRVIDCAGAGHRSRFPRYEATDVSAPSAEVDTEIADLLERPRFAAAISAARRARIFHGLRDEALGFTPSERVTDCRDEKDDNYLELPAARAWAIVRVDALLVLHSWRDVRVLRPATYLAEAGGGAQSSHL